MPYLDQVVRKLIELGYERALRAVSLGSSVRLGQEQLPHIWVLHRQVVNSLDLAAVPDLYLTQFPFANAMTIGVGKPIVVLNSELVTLLDADGQRAVLAHEAAHIHSDHVLYQNALMILLRLSQSLPLLAGLPLMPIRYALLEWFRAAELSCDRAAALLTRDPQAVCRTLMVLSAGAAAEHLNLDAFLKQGMDYSEKGTGRRAPLAPDPGPPGHPPAARQARPRAARLGARGRLRPHRRRRVHAPRRGAAAAARSATTPPPTTASGSRARSRRRARRSTTSASRCGWLRG